MKYMCHIIFLCLSCLNISCTKNYSETKMIVSSTDEGNQALQEFLMACNPKQQVFYNNYHRHRQHQHDHHQNHQHEHHHHQYDYHHHHHLIFTAFNGPGVLPDQTNPTNPQIPTSPYAAEGIFDQECYHDNGKEISFMRCWVHNNKEEERFKFSAC